jgi:hypothetical protein
MQPESSDGFASVGTVLPKEEVALLPGDLFVIPLPPDPDCERTPQSFARRSVATPEGARSQRPV